MTRINLVPPEELHYKHLLAEYRELPRVFGLVQMAHTNRGGLPQGRPKVFTLGKGHVIFFYDKLAWLEERFDLIVAECLTRGFNIQHRSLPRIHVSPTYWNYWHPRPEDVALSAARIKERMPA
jgi:hypothetical protein